MPKTEKILSDAELAHLREEYHRESFPDWPPFPLPDKYDGNDPGLVDTALGAISLIRLNLRPELPVFGEQLRIAVEVAFTVRRAWVGMGLRLRRVPLAANLRRPTERDWLELRQWFLDAQYAIAEMVEQAKRNALEGGEKPPPPPAPSGEEPGPGAVGGALPSAPVVNQTSIFNIVGGKNTLAANIQAGRNAHVVQHSPSSDGRPPMLVLGILLRSALVFACLEGAAVLCAWRWAIGENLWQRITQSWPWFTPGFAISVFVYRFLLGRERSRAKKPSQVWPGAESREH